MGPQCDPTTNADHVSTTDEPAPTREAQPCPGCRRPNTWDRVLCATCGRDLDGEDTAVWLTGRDTSRAVGTSGRAWWRRLGRLGLVIATLMFAGVVTGVALWLAGVWPFAGEPEPFPPVAYPGADAYPGEPDVLDIARVGTVTVRGAEGGTSFGPERLVDGDPTTAWHADPSAAPADVDEKIDLELAVPSWVHAVVIGNGDHADTEAYRLAGHVELLEVAFDGGLVRTVDLLDLGPQLQVIELDEPVLTTSLRITLAEVSPGDAHPGPALSLVTVLGQEADSGDAATARERAESWAATDPPTGETGVPRMSLRP